MTGVLIFTSLTQNATRYFLQSNQVRERNVDIHSEFEIPFSVLEKEGRKDGWREGCGGCMDVGNTYYEL